MATGKIVLEGMEFFAFHGFYAVEQKIGNHFIVDVTLSLNLMEAGKSDKLAETVNYEEVYKIIKQKMEITAALIETVAYGIKSEILSTFNKVQDVEVKIAKLNPAFPGKIQAVKIIV